jgi:predicted metal-dependent hydrolase
MHEIPVRKMEFEFPDEIDPLFAPGSPERSFAMIGLSLLLPYLEPYLIRTMKVARKQISDPELIADLDHFSAQESQHYQQHKRFNDALHVERYPGLAELEAELDADYRRFSKTKSLRFNLAYAEGFEALTTAVARFSFENGMGGELTPEANELFTWHLLEELEHRTVAFEVYDHVCGKYFYRLFVGLYAQWHMSRFVRRVAGLMIAASPEIMEACGGKAGSRERLRKTGRDARRSLLPKLLATYLPGYTPAKIEFTPEMQALAKGYSEKAVAHL